jgi:TonB family protein
MNTTIVNFMLESGISLAIFTLVYWLFLRKETFFVLNRIYLLGSACFSILLPFIHFQVNSEMPSVMLDEVTITTSGYQNLLQTVLIYSNSLNGTIEKTIQSIGLFSLIYLVGTAIFFLVFLYRLLQITALIMNKESELKDGIRIIKIDRETTPFSFFNFVFINKNNANSPGINEMLTHEMEHVRQKHSFDVLIFELLTIIQWFNPFVWLLKRSIRENHEFLADHGVLKPEVSSAAYRMLLLNSAFIRQPVIANNFNYSLIKIRIKMITKIKSSKTAALKLLLGVIVTATLLVIFAFDKEKNQVQNKKTDTKLANIVVDSVVVEKQQKSIPTEEQTFTIVEQPATFQGGDLTTFRTWVQKNTLYPKIAKEKGVSGKVFVQFSVNSKGEVVDVKVLRHADSLLDEEAVRTVSSSPKWEPAMQKGIKVKQQFTIPIAFVNDEQKSQQTDEPVFLIVEKSATFQGGDLTTFRTWVAENIKYPEIALKNGITGKVFVQFAVNSKGEVVDIRVLRSVDTLIDEEAVRVVKSSPKWEPAEQRGTKVKQIFNIPVSFTIKK